MPMTWRRGNTIPETATVMMFVLLIIFGILQFALIAFQQAEGDAAAFVGAHATVQADPSATTADTTMLTSLVRTVFPRLSFTPSANGVGGTFETILTQPGVQFNLPYLTGGAPSTIAQVSRVVEARTGRATGTGTSMINYCATGNLGANFGGKNVSIFTAANVVNTANGATAPLALPAVANRDNLYKSIQGDLAAIPALYQHVTSATAPITALLGNPLVRPITDPILATLAATPSSGSSAALSSTAGLVTAITGVEPSMAKGTIDATNGVVSTITSTVAANNATIAALNGLVGSTSVALSPLLVGLTPAVTTYNAAVQAADTKLADLATLEQSLMAADPTGAVAPCPTQ